MSHKLSILDYVFSILSDAKTPLDFAFVLHLPASLSIEALELGARSARNKFPITNSFLYQRRWEEIHTNDSALEITIDETSVDAFMDRPFDLRVDPPCRQLLIATPESLLLITRFHHAAADGLSAAMWMSHQLQVATGKEAPIKSRGQCITPRLKQSPTSVRRSKFAYSTPSTPLRTCTNGVSNRRHWQSFSFDATELKLLIRKRGFSYNDLLAACALEVLIKWNERHHDPTATQVGLWLPMNVRREICSGFGNGTSRVRIYPRYARQTSLIEKAREVRRQVEWCTENGEWAVPDVERFLRLPSWLSASLLNAYLASRFVDMGTAVFSHGESRANGVGKGLQIADRIECIGLLQKRQRLAINGTTHKNHTCLTLTYDSGLFCTEAIKLLCEMYREQIELALRELRNAGSS
jgi:hypothetical protein